MNNQNNLNNKENSKKSNFFKHNRHKNNHKNNNKNQQQPDKPVAVATPIPATSVLNAPVNKPFNQNQNQNRNNNPPQNQHQNQNQMSKKNKKKHFNNKYNNKNNNNFDENATANVKNINANANIKVEPEPVYNPPVEQFEEEYVPAVKPEPEIVDTSEKVEIVGIRYKPVGKVYFFSPNGEKYSANDKLIVETTKGIELGYVVIPNRNISINKIVQPLKPVLRKASEEDILRSERNKKLAKETIKVANDRIKFHNLNNMKMKLIEAEYTFDNSKLTYYFTADGRVDFRELVKDLAAIFKTRIEMRQIGIRDQTKILGGLSICGRPFCCNSFLQDFAQVTIKMAKEQNMSINSAKISGACGRLMCCLKYEHEAYDYLSKDTPKQNSIVEISTGETGVVTDSNILTGICKVKINPKPGVEGEPAIKSFPKKNLKVIGFIKNEQDNKTSGNNKNNDEEIILTDD